MRDLQANLAFVELYNATFSGDAWAKYFDSRGLRCVGFLVSARMTTGSGGNTLTPKVYGSNTLTAPQTATEYTLCAAGELLSAFTAYDDTDNHVEFVALKEDRAYRYYTVKLEEDGTAVGEVVVLAVVEKMAQPSEGVSVTTGAVS